jgi:hypothetical protein
MSLQGRGKKDEKAKKRIIPKTYAIRTMKTFAAA